MGQWAWPRIAAVYVIVVTPGTIAFAFAQRLFLKGLMEGGAEGLTRLPGGAAVPHSFTNASSSRWSSSSPR